ESLPAGRREREGTSRSATRTKRSGGGPAAYEEARPERQYRRTAPPASTPPRRSDESPLWAEGQATARPRTCAPSSWPRRRPRGRRSATELTIGRTVEADGARRLMWTLRRAFAAQDRGDRLEQDLEVQAQRPALDVVEVQLQPLRERELAPSGDLPQAGETRLHAEAPTLDALVEEVHVAQRHGARPDEAHLAGQHVEDLG